MQDIWFGTSGPRDAEIVIVGESWGSEEEAAGRPFVGSSGAELRRMLAEAGIVADRCLMTNVVPERPLGNETWRFFHPKDFPGGRNTIGGLDPRDNVRAGVTVLYEQISSFPRKVVIGVGAYALWALSHQAGTQILRESNFRKIPKELQPRTPTGIMNWRGSMWYVEPHTELLNGTQIPQTRFLPIIHPAAILRQWALRAPTVHDLKARVPLALKKDWRSNPLPEFWAPPTFQQATSRLNLWLDRANSGETVLLAEDIETARGLITCLGFADSRTFAMSIPFVRKTADIKGAPLDSWWSEREEAEIVHLIRRVNRHPNVQIIGQNFIYDTQYISHWMGVTPKLHFDTMLAQNVLYPGTPKGLDYLSSMYCHYHWYWKEDGKEWDTSGTIEELLLYNCEDCIRTWDCASTQQKLLDHFKMQEQWAFKMRTNELCLRMMQRGVRIDTAKRGAVLMELNDALQELYSELEHIVPQKMVDPAAKTPWYRSSQQQQFLFYDQFGMRTINNRKTGNATIGKEALMELKKRHPEFAGLFNRLDYAGSIANTANVVRAPLDPDNRMRCSFNPGGAETHRLSSSKNAFGRGTNFQNLTKGEEDE